MNIILFYPSEILVPLARSDTRAVHILTVLRRKVGESFDVGLVNGPRGKAMLREQTSENLILSYEWHEPPPPLAPIRLIIGFPRPQTARDILRDGATMGVSGLDFVLTDRTERSYCQSSLWATGEWKKFLLTGAAQAFCTRLPEVTRGQTLTECLSGLRSNMIRIALDNYESPSSLSSLELPCGSTIAIAIGSERGWTSAERDQLRTHGFQLMHLGERVLRTETACIAAVTLLKAKLGLL